MPETQQLGTPTPPALPVDMTRHTQACTGTRLGHLRILPKWWLCRQAGCLAGWAGDSELPGGFSMWVISLQAAGQVVV